MGSFAGFSKTIVKVETDAGIVGWEEGSRPADAKPSTARAVPLLGCDPIDHLPTAPGRHHDANAKFWGKARLNEQHAF